MSSFNPNIPIGTTLLSVDYKNIQQNMSQLDTTYGVNHFKFSDATANNGLHKFVQMTPNIYNPAAGILSQGVVNLQTANGETQLFYSPDNSGLNYQLTATNSPNTATFAASRGWTFLPGGLLLQYGKDNVNTSGTTTLISFPRAFKAATVPYSLTLGFIDDQSPSPGANSVFIDSTFVITNSQFRLINSSSGHLISVYWMAIGAAFP